MTGNTRIATSTTWIVAQLIYIISNLSDLHYQEPPDYGVITRIVFFATAQYQLSHHGGR